ncbi:hypothetical protein D3C72_1125730 [compost metagenome]
MFFGEIKAARDVPAPKADSALGLNDNLFTHPRSGLQNPAKGLFRLAAGIDICMVEHGNANR